MQRRTKVAVIAGGAVTTIALTAGIGFAAANGDDQPLTGDTLDRAVAAALEHTGAGKVTETEIGDDGAAYEVEVQLPDGSQVEVQLDQDFAVIGADLDDDGGPDDSD